MRFLLTRPIDDSEPLATKLREKNFHVHIDPLMMVNHLDLPQMAAHEFQAVIFTSANGVRACEAISLAKNQPVYVVGNKTAQVAYDIGIKQVNSADGNVKKLSEKIISEMEPAKGPLLYLCGAHVAGDLCGDLKAAGFKVIRHVVYESVAVDQLSLKTIDLLNSGSIDYIPFYSPRSALIFKKLIKKAGLEDALANVSALCLSSAVLSEISALNWKEIMTANRPTQDDLYKLLHIEL